MIRCPCCNCLTIDNSLKPIVEICDVCFWQYDEVAQDNPEKNIGPNHVSLVQARLNYNKYGASEYRFINCVRKPNMDEI